MEPTLTPTRSLPAAHRDWLCRLVFACILVSLLYSFFSRTMIHQWCSPSLRRPYVDPAYWLLLLSGIPSFLSGHYFAALVFDLALFGSCLLVLIFPGRRLFVVIFFLLYTIYFLTFNLYGNWHTGGKVGVLLAPIPFMVRDIARFNLLWEGLRYFTLFVYADAFLWKLFRGTWLHGRQGVLIIRENLAPYLFYHPGTVQARMYYWFLQHPSITDWLFKAGWITEGLFLVGFLTRRFDRGLLLASLLLPIGFFIFADAFFFELYILSLTLVSWGRVFYKLRPVDALSPDS